MLQTTTDITQDNKDTNTFLERVEAPYKLRDTVSGAVIAIEPSRVFIDLSPFGTGIIYGREFLAVSDVLRKVKIGDQVSAQICNTNNQNGYIELSLKEARRALLWQEAERLMKSKEILDVIPEEANRGGLIIPWQNIKGFLPASQLTQAHYPKVADGDKSLILEELNRLVGKHLSVSIITVQPKEDKIIFSERGQDGTNDNAKADPEMDITEAYAVDDVVTGVVTGIVDFGMFIKLENNIEGLVHISEIQWGLVDNPYSLYKVGDEVSAKVILVKKNRLSLSIKALKENPWDSVKNKYNKGETVTGVIIKHDNYGALASVEEGVAGLIHVSNYDSLEELRGELALGSGYDFTITVFEPEKQKMSLVPVGKTRAASPHIEKEVEVS